MLRSSSTTRMRVRGSVIDLDLHGFPGDAGALGRLDGQTDEKRRAPGGGLDGDGAARTTPAMSHQSHWSRRAPESRAVASSRSETNRARRADSEAMLVRKRSVVAASNDTSDWHRLEA